ncbi:MAG: hypothetical protein JNK72_25780 [Myxococcales bacterium]|nr:hypothetical protein [Myxococcales bacterium]
MAVAAETLRTLLDAAEDQGASHASFAEPDLGGITTCAAFFARGSGA